MLDRTSSEFGYLELLGRVKVALASSREVAVAATEVRPYPGQPRKYFDTGATQRLSESIDASGQTTAGIIRRCPGPTEYELIDGERRWRAVLLIPEARRPLYRARLIDADDDVVQYLISGIANFNREGHAPLETCDTICRLASFKLPMHAIAALLGVSEMWAGQMHALRRLIPEVRAMLAPELLGKDRLPVTAAIEIAKCTDGKIQLSLAQRVLSRNVSLADLRVEVVRESKKAGVYVQTRSSSPDQRWRAIINQVATAARAAHAIELALGAAGTQEFIERRRSAREVVQLVTRLREARALLEQSEHMLAQWGKKCS